MISQLTLENSGTGIQVYGTMSIEGGITLVGVPINATKVAIVNKASFHIQSTANIGSLTGGGIVEISDCVNYINLANPSTFQLIVIGGDTRVSGMGPYLNHSAGRIGPIGTVTFDFATMKEGTLYGDVLQVKQLILGDQETIAARLRVMNVANITGGDEVSVNVPGILEIQKQAIVYQNSPISANLGNIQMDGTWMVSKNFDYINGLLSGSGNWNLYAETIGTAPTFSSYSSINVTGPFKLYNGSRIITRGQYSYFKNITGDSNSIINGGGADFMADYLRIGVFIDSTVSSTVIGNAILQNYEVNCCGNRRFGTAMINSTTIVDGSFGILFGYLKGNYFAVGNGNVISFSTNSDLGSLFFSGGTIGVDVAPVTLSVTNTTYLLKEKNPKIINNGVTIVTDVLDCSNCNPIVPYCGFISGYSYIRPNRISGPCHTAI